jgi:cell division septum initiation protein DivIVA
MGRLGQTDLDSVNTVQELANFLQQLRLLRIDRMSYARMADSIKNEISRSEMSRILTGADFPSRAQLHLILDILKMARTGREKWDAMWDRLAQDLYASDGWQRKPLDLPTSTSGQGTHLATENHRDTNPSGGRDDDSEQRRATAIIENAYDEADRIVRSARVAAENERETLIQDARTAASSLIDKFMVELTQIIQDNQVKIAGIVSDAEEKLKTVIVALNDSANNNHRTSEELRQLISDVRASMGEIRSELVQVREEAESIREGYGADRGTRQSPVPDESKRKRPRLLSSILFSDDRKPPPAIIDEQPDLGGSDFGDDDNTPPWLKDY